MELAAAWSRLRLHTPGTWPQFSLVVLVGVCSPRAPVRFAWNCLWNINLRDSSMHHCGSIWDTSWLSLWMGVYPTCTLSYTYLFFLSLLNLACPLPALLPAPAALSPGLKIALPSSLCFHTRPTINAGLHSGCIHLHSQRGGRERKHCKMWIHPFRRALCGESHSWAHTQRH